MLLQPLPHQSSGALWLAQRKTALLADEPRVGKTGTAIIAADLVDAERILVVTTASGRAVWESAFGEWSILPRTVTAVYQHLYKPVPVTIVGWHQIHKPHTYTTQHEYDLLILDEAHYGMSAGAQRTQVGLGHLPKRAARTWCLTGTPIPSAPNNLWTMLRALAPERLGRYLHYADFEARFCIVQESWESGRERRVVKGGKNEDELAAMLDGFMLRRTQADVGIGQPVYETLPIHISEAQRFRIEAELGEEAAAILEAAEVDATNTLEMHLGPLRRVTGTIKATGVAAVVNDEIKAGALDKVVLMVWHQDTASALRQQLAPGTGVVSVMGSTTPDKRREAQRAFRNDPECRVFIGQMEAAGEAIDLSAAAELIFVEASFVPKHMKQASLRITNHMQKRQCRVRVAALQGSIDEAVTRILVRRTASIREVLK